MPPKIPDRRSAGSVHDSSLPQWAIDKMARRRARCYAFENIDPARTALVIIDLVRAALESTPCAASIIDPVRRLASTLRAAGGTIVWVTPAPVAPDHPILEALWGTEHLQMIAAQTASGSAANDLADGLTPEPQDLAVYK